MKKSLLFVFYLLPFLVIFKFLRTDLINYNAYYSIIILIFVVFKLIAKTKIEIDIYLKFWLWYIFVTFISWPLTFIITNYGYLTYPFTAISLYILLRYYSNINDYKYFIKLFLLAASIQAALGISQSLFGLPIISLCNGSKITIGKNLVLISTSYFSEPGVNHPVIIRTLNKDAELLIGENVGISGGGICCQKKVIIGNNVMFGANTFVTDTDFHPVDPKNRRYTRKGTKAAPVIIEDNVFLGMNVLVLKGVKIGKNSIIAAGSIVTSDIEENSIAAGIPAIKIKSLIN